MWNLIRMIKGQRGNNVDDIDIVCLKQHYDTKFRNSSLMNDTTKSAKARVESKYKMGSNRLIRSSTKRD